MTTKSTLSKSVERLKDCSQPLGKLPDKETAAKLLVIALFLISCFNMLLGFTSWGDMELNQKTYTDRFYSFKPVQPNFYEERLSNFQEYGARSEVLMSLSDRSKGLDVTYRAPYGPGKLEIGKIAGKGILLSTQLIPVIIALLIITGFLWSYSRKLAVFGGLLALVLLSASVNISGSYLLGGYGDSSTATDGSMTLMTHTDEGEIPYLKLTKTSPKESVELNISVNGKTSRRINIHGTTGIGLVSARTGWNRIEIDSKCHIPALTETGSRDIRCLSFRVDIISSNTTSDFTEPVLAGFYGEELDGAPWMGREAHIVFASENKRAIPSLEMEKVPFLDEFRPEFSVNGENVHPIITETEEGKKILLSNANISEGINHIRITSPSCKVPAEESDSGDERCLSYRLTNLSLRQNPPEIMFRKGWHSPGETGRWMKEKGEILTRLDSRNSVLRLKMNSYHELENNTAKIFFNGENIRNTSLSRTNEIFLPVQGRKGYNSLKIESKKGCVKPVEVEKGSSDNRCLSIYMEEVNITDIDDARYQKGWYAEEQLRSGGYRWMKNRSYIVYNSSGGDILSFSAVRYSGVENSSLRVFADGEKVAEFDSDNLENRQTFIISEPGTTSLRFESSAGCVSPSEVEKDSNDDRCLSFRFSDINIEEKAFGKGWYLEEGDSEFSYRWMESKSRTTFVGNGNKTTLVMEFKPYRHLSDPSLEVIINQESIGTLRLQGRGRVREKIRVDTERGINNLTLRSNSGCEIPSEHERLSNDRRCLSFQFSKLEISR